VNSHELVGAVKALEVDRREEESGSRMLIRLPDGTLRDVVAVQNGYPGIVLECGDPITKEGK
jgi:hypothetical protein